MNKWDIELNENNFEKSYDKLVNIIKENLVSAGGKVLNNEFKARAPAPSMWWNSECTEKVNNRKKALKELMNEYSETNYIKFKKACKETTKFLQKTKKKYFIIFCDSLNPEMKIDKIWNYIKSFKKRKLLNNNMDSNWSSNPKISETIDKIAPKITPPQIKIKKNNNINKFLDKKIKVKEVKSAINKTKIRSAPGKDMISYKIIKQLPRRVIEVITKMYNYIIDSGKIPGSWKDQFVCLIPKPKDKRFRPIALSSCLQKIMERIINDRLQWYLESRKIFPNQFFGFRRAKSCNNSLSILVTDIKKSFILKQIIIAGFIDINSAYDNVDIQILVDKMTEYNITDKNIRFIINIMSSRNLHFLFQNRVIDTRVSSKGLAPGSI